METYDTEASHPTPGQAAPRRNRRGLKRALLGLMLLGGVAALIGSTLANFNASIVNTSNTFQSGTIVLKETKGATTCLSTGAGVITDAGTANCATIDKFGGASNLNQKPGGTAVTTAVVVSNDGTINAATFTLTPAATCTVTITGLYNGSNTAGFCGKVDLTIQDDTAGGPSCVYPAGAGACPALANTSTLAGLAGHAAFSLNGGAGLAAGVGAARTYTYKVQIDSTAGNDMQGLTASLNLTWNIAQ